MLFKQVQYFMAVAEHRHFTRAADTLFISQSALSQQITKLENYFGIKLINRDAHPIELTPAGREFLVYAHQLTGVTKEMQLQMQKYLPLDKRTIHLGMITGLGNIKIADILSSFTEAYPNINFTITNNLSKELCHLLQSEKIDLALFAVPYNISEYDFDLLPIEKDEFVLIVPTTHPLALKTHVDLADTLQEKFIFPTKENVSYDIFLTQCKLAGFSPKIISECNNPGRRVDLVQGGLGISLISLSGLQYYNHNNIAIVKLKQPFFKEMALAKKIHPNPSHLVTAFWEHIRKNKDKSVIKS